VVVVDDGLATGRAPRKRSSRAASRRPASRRSLK
jgi:predicted phosphoribosyltransferase